MRLLDSLCLRAVLVIRASTSLFCHTQLELCDPQSEEVQDLPDPFKPKHSEAEGDRGTDQHEDVSSICMIDLPRRPLGELYLKGPIRARIESLITPKSL